MVRDEVSIPEPSDRLGVEVAAGQRVTFKVRGPDVLRTLGSGSPGSAATATELASASAVARRQRSARRWRAGIGS